MPLPSQEAWIRRITMARKRAASNKIHIEQQNYLNLYNLLHRLRGRRHNQSNMNPALQLDLQQAPLVPTTVRRIARPVTTDYGTTE
jgi:hypothetical protein